MMTEGGYVCGYLDSFLMDLDEVWEGLDEEIDDLKARLEVTKKVIALALQFAGVSVDDSGQH